MPSTRAKRQLSEEEGDSEQECATCREELDEKASWVSCEECEAWHHWDCVRPTDDAAVEQIDKWYCEACIAGSHEWETPLEITYKDTPRKSARTTSKHNYANLELGENDPEKWIRIAESKPIQPNNFKRMKGKDLTLDWVMSDPEAFLEPIIIESPEGLDMRMPRNTMTVFDVANSVGADRPVEVMDVASQNSLEGWTLGRWAQYFHDPNRSKIRNVISLEVSDTKLTQKVIPPKIVRQLDWIETIWPKRMKDQGVYPKVQKYCLMSVAKCWTDWHVDFAASSVYYHILSGGKTFFFIRPTAENLRKYELWSGSSLKQEQEWLGDNVDAVYRVDLEAGNTMIIPSGWIHSVYTPADALVFGGNFLHSLNIGTQLRIFEIEKKTKVPMKYRFPYFVTFLWYVAKYYSHRLDKALAEQTRVYEKEKAMAATVLAAKQAERAAAAGEGKPLDFSDEKDIKPVLKVKLSEIDGELTHRVLLGLKKLTIFLLEQGERFSPDSKATADAKRWARDNLPEDVSDPYEFAIAFRAQLLSALDEKEDLPSLAQPLKKSLPPSAVPQKRKAPSAAAPVAAPGVPKFKNFAPPDSKKVQKIEGGGSITEQTERQDPVNTVTRQKRARPNPSGFEEGNGELEDVEVRMMSTETRVTRIARQPDGRITREVRTVRTTVERTAWPSGHVNGHSNGMQANGLSNGHRSASVPRPQPIQRVQQPAQSRPQQQQQPLLPYQRTSAHQSATHQAAAPSQNYLQYGTSAPLLPQYSLPAPKPSPYVSQGTTNPAMYSSAMAYGSAAPAAAYGQPPIMNGMSQQDMYQAILSSQMAQGAYYQAQQYSAPAQQYGIPASHPNGSS